MGCFCIDGNMCVNHLRFTVSSPACGGSNSVAELCMGVNKAGSVNGRLEPEGKLGSCAHSEIVDVIEKSSALTSKSSSRNQVPDSERAGACGDVSSHAGMKLMVLGWTRSDVPALADKCAVGLTVGTEAPPGTGCTDSAAETGVSTAGSSGILPDGLSTIELCEPIWSPWLLSCRRSTSLWLSGEFGGEIRPDRSEVIPSGVYFSTDRAFKGPLLCMASNMSREMFFLGEGFVTCIAFAIFSRAYPTHPVDLDRDTSQEGRFTMTHEQVKT